MGKTLVNFWILDDTLHFVKMCSKIFNWISKPHVSIPCSLFSILGFVLGKMFNKILQFLEYKKYIVFSYFILKRKKIKYTAWKNTYMECVFKNYAKFWTISLDILVNHKHWNWKECTLNMIQQKRNTYMNSFVVHFVESFPFEHPHFKSLS